MKGGNAMKGPTALGNRTTWARPGKGARSVRPPNHPLPTHALRVPAPRFGVASGGEREGDGHSGEEAEAERVGRKDETAGKL